MVSVVILTLKHPRMVLSCLGNQSYREFEIIIATEKGIVNAMNQAVRKAKGDIIVRIDDDVWMAMDWLKELIRPFEDPQVAGVTGPTWVNREDRENRDSIRCAEKPNRFLRWMFDGRPGAVGTIYKCGSVSYGSNYGPRLLRERGCDHLEGTNWAMRADLIKRVGYFDPAFDGVAEWFDTDVEYKIKKLGYKLWYNPQAELWHLLEKGAHYNERFQGWSRMKNWLRFHWRHSRFHPKMIIWFTMMGGYFLWQRCRSLFRR